MDNPDIKDYINNLDNNKENNDRIVDEKEVQLLNTTLGSTENNLDLVNVLNEQSELKRLTKFIVKGIENQKDSTSLGYYTEFVQKFQNYMIGLPDKDMSLVNELNSVIVKQREEIERNTNSIQEKENTIQGNKQLDKADNKSEIQHEEKTNDIDTTIILNQFENQFPELNRLMGQNNMKELFRLNENLRNSQVDIGHIDFLDEMANFYKPLLELPISDAINKITSIMESLKMEESKKDLLKKEFVPLLTAILEKKDTQGNSVMKEFVRTIDKDIKGSSYDTLLKTETLESNDAKKSINTIFHRDEQMFNQLVQDFKEPAKKGQVEKIVKEYVQLSLPKENLEGTTIEIGEVVLKDGEGKDIKKPCFNVMKDGKIIEVSTGKQDDKGQDIKQKLTPFFGDAKNGKPLMLKKTIEENQWLKDAMGIGPDNIKQLDPKLKDLMNSTINTKNGPRSISEAISSLFDSPLFLEIKQAFLALLSMMGDDADKQTKYAIEANFAQAERDLSKITETVDDKNNNKISYLKALKSLNLENKTIEGIGNPLELFANAPLVSQKEYIKAVIGNPGTRYDKDKMTILGKTTNTSNPEQQKDDGKKDGEKTETTDIKEVSQEFKNEQTYKELSLDSTKPGKVEKIDTDKNNPYLKIDGQVIPLINGKGSVFIKSDGKIFEKEISITKDNNKKEIISIKNGKELEDVNSKSNDLTNQDGQMFRLRKYLNIDQGPKTEPLMNMIMNLPQGDIKNKTEKAIVVMKNKINGLDSGKRTKEEINRIINEVKTYIVSISSSLPKKDDIKNIVESWANDMRGS